MNNAVERIKAYIARRKMSRGIDVNNIHGFDVSPDGGFELTVADIEALIERIEAMTVDAERYRWLLENYAFGDGYANIDSALNDGEADKYLSVAIDAAMALEKK